MVLLTARWDIPNPTCEQSYALALQTAGAGQGKVAPAPGVMRNEISRAMTVALVLRCGCVSFVSLGYQQPLSGRGDRIVNTPGRKTQ